jgi:hypothetical protein
METGTTVAAYKLPQLQSELVWNTKVPQGAEKGSV